MASTSGASGPAQPTNAHFLPEEKQLVEAAAADVFGQLGNVQPEQPQPVQLAAAGDAAAGNSAGNLPPIFPGMRSL